MVLQPIIAKHGCGEELKSLKDALMNTEGSDLGSPPQNSQVHIITQPSIKKFNLIIK